MDDDPDAPISLDYNKPERAPFWPANPFSVPGAIGMTVALPVPVLFVLWSHCAENVIRVPRLGISRSFSSR